MASGRTRTLVDTAEMDVDFNAEKVEVFDEGWSLLRDNYYDDQFHGADWNAVRQAFAPHAIALHDASYGMLAADSGEPVAPLLPRSRGGSQEVPQCPARQPVIRMAVQPAG